MTEDCKTDEPDATGVQSMSSIRAVCRGAFLGRPGWADEVRAAVESIVCDPGADSPTSAQAGRIAVARERIRAAVDIADPDAVLAAVDRLEALVGMPARVPGTVVPATAPGPPGRMMR